MNIFMLHEFANYIQIRNVVGADAAATRTVTFVISEASLASKLIEEYYTIRVRKAALWGIKHAKFQGLED